MPKAEIRTDRETCLGERFRGAMNHVSRQRSPNSIPCPSVPPSERARRRALTAVTLNYSDEMIGFKRLVKDIGSAGHDRPLGMAASGQDYYRDIQQHRIGVSVCEKLVTVHHWHHEVEQYQARRI